MGVRAQIGEGREARALGEIRESGSDCGPIIEHWAVIDVIGCPIETLIAAPPQKGVLAYGPSGMEDRGEEGVCGRGVVRG